MVRINAGRLEKQLSELGHYGENEQGGVDRSIGSEADLQAREYLKKLWRDMGLQIRTDAIANLWACQPGSEEQKKPIAVGSHHDAVPNGGKFDGALGVLMATEVLKTIQENEICLRHPYTVVSFTAEEPNPFNLSTMGSRSVTGKISEKVLETAKDANGRLLAGAIQAAGGDVRKIGENQLEKGDLAAFLECHIEQGRNLFDRNLSVAVVSRITGIYREIITVRGEANHAGTTLMKYRHDALLAGAELALAVEKTAQQQGRNDVVATVGKFDVMPNAANIIPGEVKLIMELRTPDQNIREQMLEEITTEIHGIEQKRNVAFERCVNLNQAEVLMDETVRAAIEKGCQTVQDESVELVSMAGHDSVHMSGIGKTGMLFVQSVNGISHSNLEFTEMKDIENAANALLQAVLLLDEAL